MDNMALWLIVVGIFTLVIGVGLMYVMWIIASVQRRIAQINKEMHGTPLRASSSSTAAVAVGKEGGPAADAMVRPQQGQQQTTSTLKMLKEVDMSLPFGLEGLASLAVPVATADHNEAADDAAAAAAAGERLPLSEILSRVKALEHDVALLQNQTSSMSKDLATIAKHSASGSIHDPLLALTSGIAGGQHAAGSAASSPDQSALGNRRGSKIFQELISQMRERQYASPHRPSVNFSIPNSGEQLSSQQQQAAAAADDDAAASGVSLVSKRLHLKRPTQVHMHTSSKYNAHGGEFNGDLSVSPIFAHRRGAGGGEGDATSESLSLASPTGLMMESPLRGGGGGGEGFPRPVDCYVVLHAPPNLTRLPADEIPSLGLCSLFESRRFDIGVDDAGSVVLRIFAQQQQVVATTQSSITSSRSAASSQTSHEFQQPIATFKIKEFDSVVITIDELPKQRTRCAVIILIKWTGGGGNLASASVVAARKKSAVVVGGLAGFSSSATKLFADDHRLILCAPVEEMCEVTSFLCDNFPNLVQLHGVEEGGEVTTKRRTRRSSSSGGGGAAAAAPPPVSQTRVGGSSSSSVSWLRVEGGDPNAML